MHLLIRMFAFLMMCYFIAPPLAIANNSMSKMQYSCCANSNSSHSNCLKTCCKKKHQNEKKSASKACGNANCGIIQNTTNTVFSFKNLLQLPRPNEMNVASFVIFKNDNRKPTSTHIVLDQPPKQ